MNESFRKNEQKIQGPMGEENLGESEVDVYKTLKDNVLNGSLSFSELRDRLLELDQKTPSRDACLTNLEFLKDSDIYGIVLKSPETADEYKKFLSFTEFHVAQKLAHENDQNSIFHFQEALKAAEDSGNEGWIAYIKGTLLYMEGKEIPEELIKKSSESGRNSDILRNLNEGLKHRGKPSHTEDYEKE